jgi:hypothetical protein
MKMSTYHRTPLNTAAHLFYGLETEKRLHQHSDYFGSGYGVFFLRDLAAWIFRPLAHGFLFTSGALLALCLFWIVFDGGNRVHGHTMILGGATGISAGTDEHAIQSDVLDVTGDVFAAGELKNASGLLLRQPANEITKASHSASLKE